MKRVICLLAALLLSHSAQGIETVCDSMLPWKMPAAKPKKTTAVHVVVNSDVPVATTLCYCNGPLQSYVDVLANSDKKVVSRLYHGSCVFAVGKQIRLTSQSEIAVSGGFEIGVHN